ncbi:hypothetical protein E1H12_16575 [Geitlerinema sp. P-1104]|nr:hypothetical protein [Geitlerinema sp. P-1104]
MVARTDLPFMMHTIPHLVRGCNFPFFKRVLVMDTAPLSGDKVNRPGVGTMEDLRAACQTLINEGLMDEVIEMDYSEEYRRQIYKKHFGIADIRPTHNYKGYPILGSIFAIENVPGDYIVHFDSDMLLHQQSGFNWIELGMDLLNRRDKVIFVRPFTGFPNPSQGVFDKTKSYDYDSEEFYQFTSFSSRAFLLKRSKFEQLLPMPILWVNFKRKWLSNLPPRVLTQLNNWTGRGKLHSWEVIISRKLEKVNCVRANLAHPQAWTLHPRHHSPEFVANLPNIIDCIERGEAPEGQVGYYDLQLESWL